MKGKVVGGFPNAVLQLSVPRPRPRREFVSAVTGP